MQKRWLPQLHREDVGNFSIPLGWLLCFIFFCVARIFWKEKDICPFAAHLFWRMIWYFLGTLKNGALLPLDVHCILPGWNCTASRPKVHSRTCRKVPRPSRRLDGWIPGVRLDAIKCWSWEHAIWCLGFCWTNGHIEMNYLRCFGGFFSYWS